MTAHTTVECPQAPTESDDHRVAYCTMLDSISSVETCLPSLSHSSSSSELLRTSPPLIPDLHISVELEDILEMLEAEPAP
jgi:hypothetical protein